MTAIDWVPFAPVFPEGSEGPAMLADFARALVALPLSESAQERNAAIEACRRRALKDKGKCDAPGRQTFVVAVHVLADLAKQGWGVRAADEEVEIAREENDAAEGEDARDRIRAQLHAERNEQLLQPATRAFVKGMQAKQLFGQGFVSIYSLMRDGQELAARLREVRDAKESERAALVGNVVSPYLQFIRGEDDCCSFTGLRLMDIWRYFRHTWANPYKSIPGRSMMVLVRDAAAPCHPVMGIAALSSAAVAMTARDEKIGWTPAVVVDEIKKQPTARLAAWLNETVDEAIDELYKIDFFEAELLSAQSLKCPSQNLVRTLEAEGRQQRKEHHRFMESGDYKKSESANGLTEKHWEEQARSPLFRSKRALELSNLLSVRMILQRFFGETPSKNMLTSLVGAGEGRDAVARIVRSAKADRVGTVIADLTVCGAVPPYNEILGGKLVAMLMVGPEVVLEYRRRYGGTPSVIASSMAGKATVRPVDLVFIGTTSLYGLRPSQYDRITIPLDPVSGKGSGLRYDYLGRTRGIGTFQFGDQTVSEMAILLSQSKRGQQVNSVFGEGVNPRLRKIRDGLDALNLPTGDLLNHGGPRLVYGVELTHNTHAYLLGIERRPIYILPSKNPAGTTRQIAGWWARRWLLSRITRDEVLEAVARHNFVYPIRHGARIDLPEIDQDGFASINGN